eukprot:3312378-Pyramimonas_sp.AAC.1
MSHGCEAWAVTQEVENRVRGTQRQLLRMISRAPRRSNRNLTGELPPRDPEPKGPRGRSRRRRDFFWERRWSGHFHRRHCGWRP